MVSKPTAGAHHLGPQTDDILRHFGIGSGEDLAAWAAVARRQRTAAEPPEEPDEDQEEEWHSGWL